MMDEWTAAFEAWTRAHAAWAAPVTFTIAFLESLPIISIFVPSTALLLTMGALIGAGLVPAWPVVLACMIGGILGDAVGYWVARAIGPYAVRKRLPKSLRRGYAWSTAVFRRWGWWAVFVGRFVGPMRAVTPLAAGVVGLRNRTFQSANVLSAILWAPLVLMPGSVGGWLAKQVGPETDPKLLLGAAAAALLGWMLFQRFRPAVSLWLREKLNRLPAGR